MKMFVKRKLLDVNFSVASQNEVLEYILEKIYSEAEKFYIVTPNPEILVIASKDKEYKKVLNFADLALPDGIGIILASKFLGISLRGRIPGVDLVENLCREVSVRPITVSFVGGRPGIAERTAECLKKIYPSLKVKFSGQEITNFDKLRGTDILFVAFGSPKQEFWIAENLKKLPVKVAIGVGGSFDMISGEVKRAPIFVRKLGLEWAYRLIKQPWRAKRQLSLLKFISLVAKERFNL